jgi:HSP20 family protein
MAGTDADTATTRGSQSEQERKAQQAAGGQGERQTQPPQEGQRGREAQRQQNAALQDTRRGRSGSLGLMSPFSLLQRFFSDDLASLVGGSDTRRGEMMARTGEANQDLMSQDLTSWMPNIDVVQEGNELVVRADLPGVDLDELAVNISDDTITISGVRQQERAEEHGSAYRIERTYGSFYREIPLPDGAIVDRATATFNDGVLEIRVPAPSEQVSRGRRMEITQGENAGQRDTGGEGGRNQAGR